MFKMLCQKGHCWSACGVFLVLWVLSSCSGGETKESFRENAQKKLDVELAIIQATLNSENKLQAQFAKNLQVCSLDFSVSPSADDNKIKITDEEAEYSYLFTKLGSNSFTLVRPEDDDTIKEDESAAREGMSKSAKLIFDSYRKIELHDLAVYPEGALLERQDQSLRALVPLYFKMRIQHRFNCQQGVLAMLELYIDLETGEVNLEGAKALYRTNIADMWAMLWGNEELDEVLEALEKPFAEIIWHDTYNNPDKESREKAPRLRSFDSLLRVLRESGYFETLIREAATQKVKVLD